MPEPKKSNKSKTNGNGTATVEKPEAKRTVPQKPKKAKVLEERELKYGCYKVFICCNDYPDHDDGEQGEDGKYITGSGIEYDGPITCEIAKKFLEWETEPDYVKRKLAEDPNLKESKLKFGAEYILMDADKNKVVCWANCTNRPFDLRHAESLAQDILTKNWEMNCEPIIIGRTGLVISGQHRLIALILAVEGPNGWRRQHHWQEIWETEPVLETILAVGCSEDAKVIKTIDNVKPRSLADVFYTSPLFAYHSDGKTPYNQSERNELSKMLSGAVDLLWQRTSRKQTGGDGDQFVTYQTHAASLDFLDNHQKLLMCVKHIYDEDGGKPSDLNAEEIRGKAISNGLKIQRGHAAALMYLMAQSKTKEDIVDEYYTSGGNKSEKRLDWSCWDMACQFWTDIAEQKLEWAQTLVDAVNALTVNDGNRVIFNPNSREKQSVIVNAWTKYRIKERFDHKKPELLHPKFTIDEVKNTRRILPIDEPTCKGIDLGTLDEETVDTSALTKEQVEEEKDKARAKKIKEKLDESKRNEIRADATKKVLPPKTNGEVDPITGRDTNNQVPKQPRKPVTPVGKSDLKGGTANDPF